MHVSSRSGLVRKRGRSPTRPLISSATLSPEYESWCCSHSCRHQCLEIIYRCGGDHGDARRILKGLQRSWKSRHGSAGVSAAKETAEAKAIVKKETAARLAAAPAPSSSSSSSAATGSSSKSGKAVAAGGSCPIVEGSTTVTATTTRSAVAWGGGASAASRSSGSTGGSSSGGSGGGSGRGGRSQGGRARAEGQDAFWCRPLDSLAGGELALRRQVEGGVSNSPPGTRRKDKVSPDLNLSRPWSAKEEETYTRVMLEEGSKNFYAVQVTRTPVTRTLVDSRHACAVYCRGRLEVSTCCSTMNKNCLEVV